MDASDTDELVNLVLCVVCERVPIPPQAGQIARSVTIVSSSAAPGLLASALVEPLYPQPRLM
jgi:hypothetical protein